MSKVILITGCSSGIGHDLARRLAIAGYTVIATARELKTLTDLQVALRLPLDVTDSGSVASAVKEIVRRFGRLDVLVNNAGYAVRGAVEEVSEEQVRDMFDVNVYGVMRMIRAVVPQMRQQGAGRIINISSLAGKLSVPANGAYSASKSAVEALSDALRLEVAPFGIQVVLIEPGSIKTHFTATTEAHSKEILSNRASPYKGIYERYLQFAATMRGQEAGPQVVTRVIQRAIEVPRPKARYLVGVPFTGRLVVYLGDSVWDAVLRRIFKVAPPPRPASSA